MKFVLYNIRYGTGGNVKYGGFLPYITGYLSGTAKHIKTIGEFLKEESPDDRMPGYVYPWKHGR